MTEPVTVGRVGLLARLVAFGAIQQPEVAATRSLGYLLEPPELAAEFAALIESYPEVPTGAAASVTVWRCEHSFDRFPPQPAGGVAETRAAVRARVDLVGFDAVDRPRVVIEAKFGAALTDEQVRAYASWQHDSLSGSSEAGVLALLVPTVRAGVARRLLDELLVAGGWHDVLQPVVLTWQDTLTRLREVSIGPARAQLDELLAVDAQIEGVDVAPFRDAVAERDGRREEMKKIFEAVGQWRLEAGERILPSQTRDAVFDLYRYRTLPTRTDLAIGLPKIGLLPEAPLWARFHRQTPHFSSVRQALTEAGRDIDDTGGHAWLPLHIPPNLPGAEIVPVVVHQVRDIEEIAISAVSIKGRSTEETTG